MPKRADLINIALGFPKAELHILNQEVVAKVRGKFFVYLGLAESPKEVDGRFCVKLPDSGARAIEDGVGEAMGYDYAEGAVRKLMDGWVTVKPRVASSMAKDAAWRLLRESYVAVAPKTLAKLVPGEAASPVAQTAKKAAPKKTAPKKAAPKKAAVARKAPTIASAAKRKAK